MREVVHIKGGAGPRGGKYWLLSLSCGYHRVVRQPTYRAVQAIVRPIRFAPRKVRCLCCDYGLDGKPLPAP